jgi:SWI/SNF-related matrix-associated actin-dependent regulator of chromatin subfamily A member 5
MKRFTYLLGQTELFQHFIDLKVSSARFHISTADTLQRKREPEFAAMLDEQITKQSSKKGKKAA